jgi:hypothetical protein
MMMMVGWLCYIHEELNREKIGIVPNWDVFEKTSISTKVRVSVDLYGLGDHGLGVGLFIRQRRGGEIDNNRFLNFGRNGYTPAVC